MSNERTHIVKNGKSSMKISNDKLFLSSRRGKVLIAEAEARKKEKEAEVRKEKKTKKDLNYSY